MEAAIETASGWKQPVTSARAPKRREAETSTCQVVGCDKSSSGSLCSMHAKRKQRGTPMQQEAQERLSPFGRLLEAVIAVVECPTDSDAEYARREAVARMAGVAYARHLGVYTGAADREGVAQKAVPAACSACGREVRERQEREPQRSADVGEGDPRAGRSERRGRDPDARRPDGEREGRGPRPRRRGAA